MGTKGLPTAQSKPMSQTEKLGMKMKGLSIEIYDDEQFVPKFHNFDDDFYEDSEVESAFSERTEEDFWETLVKIKQKTCEQLQNGNEVDQLIIPILNNVSRRQNTLTSE